ncbi:MAG: glycosyltransferase [Muribaculaceae bacterium]|nr:glycosyltransferase [Muribaculaceae bacterium]
MKILHVITSLRTGGAERLMVDLLPRLRDMGNEVELLLFDGTRTPFYEELENTGIKIHSLAVGGNVYNPFIIFRLFKYLKKYDIIHTHNTACQLYVAICSLLCSVVYYTTEHTTTNRRRDWWWYKPIDKWMYTRYNKTICISEQTLKNIEKYIGKHNRNIVIHNGVNLGKYRKSIKNITNNQEFIISMVAGFRYQKDQDTLIKAIALLPNDYKLWLIGDGERRSILEDLVKELGIEKRVKFWGIRNDIPELLEQTDIVVLSSHFEGFGLVAVEGMIAGRPVIASDVEGLRDIVNDAGILFPHQNYKQLAFEMEKLATDNEYYSKIASQCQERAFKYDIDFMVEKYNNLYHD